ncbi:MAG: hypothetical protein ACTHL1_12165 [Burkholderiaceae bacterium]
MRVYQFRHVGNCKDSDYRRNIAEVKHPGAQIRGDGKQVKNPGLRYTGEFIIGNNIPKPSI